MNNKGKRRDQTKLLVPHVKKNLLTNNQGKNLQKKMLNVDEIKNIYVV